MNTPKPITGLDHGTPPASLSDQNALVSSLIDLGQAIVTRQAEQTVESGAGEAVAEPPFPTPLPVTHTRQERVELEYVPDKSDLPAFRLAFTVGEVCIRENYVSMLIVSDLGFKPTSTMKFDLKYRGKVLPVIFAGAEFEFQTVGVRGISFLIDRNRKDKPTGSPVK